MSILLKYFTAHCPENQLSKSHSNNSVKPGCLSLKETVAKNMETWQTIDACILDHQLDSQTTSIFRRLLVAYHKLDGYLFRLYIHQ